MKRQKMDRQRKEHIGDEETDKWKDMKLYSQKNAQTETKKADRQTDTQRGIQTSKQTNKETNKPTY